MPSSTPTLRHLERASLALLAALAGSVLLVLPAAAHDQLVAADPAPDAVLSQPPAALTLEFSAALLDLSATVEVTGPAGPVAADPAVVAARTVTVALTGPLPDGPYAVAWRVVSSDGHPIEGTYSFTVDAPEPAPTASPTPSATSAPTGEPTAAADPAPAATPATDDGPGTDAGATGDEAASGPSSGALAVGALVLAGLAALTWWAVRRTRA